MVCSLSFFVYVWLYFLLQLFLFDFLTQTLCVCVMITIQFKNFHLCYLNYIMVSTFKSRDHKAEALPMIVV